MSAVEALAEVLREHQRELSYPWPQCSCGAWDFSTIEDHQAFVLAPAIRSMPAELKAEVVDGKVEKATKTRWFDGSGSTFWDFSEAEEYAAKASTWGDGPVTVHPVIRVITPWLPLGVSPETNGEQK